jgi:heat-inducible transcriptional repressor
MTMLTERRDRLLRFIVDEYVRTAQPVASSAAERRSGLPVSSATIRNEMARLEEEGFIEQPHTSAGRIPSDRGYRYYVEELMRPRDLSDSVKQTIRHQFHQAAAETAEWARLAASVLASRLSYGALVTAPHAASSHLRSLQLVSVHDYVALLIVVLRETLVVQHTVTLDRLYRQEELTQISARLNSLYAGLSSDEIRALQIEHLSVEAEAMRSVLSLMDAQDGQELGEPYLEGLRELLREPEFARGEAILEMFDVLGGANPLEAIPLAEAGEGITFVIGAEHPEDALRQCSVIVSRYSGPAGLRGAVGVLGPTRMHYPRAVSMVRYMSGIMEELLDAYFR